MKTNRILITLVVVIALLAAVSVYGNTQVKDEDEKLVIAFGDSLTYGYGDEKGSGYIDTLKVKLNNQNKEEFNFDNEAIYGLESSGILTQLSDVGIRGELDEADYFILFIGTNDLINSNGGNLKNLKHEEIAIGKEDYMKNLNAIISILTEQNEQAPILLLGLYNPYPDSKAIETVIDDWNNGINKMIKDEKRIVYIPTNDLFKGKNKKQYFSDSLHLNDKGYKLVSDRILEKYQFE
ncbi:GDSL-type esterase/lipase family protein [Mesobacillus sp. AQ2]|jgi:lysophospholipase L1-like esterase|uniref:GDSL-type esterase/lipase family protein n=1 Tax=Bacillaceae TaxID=186817 RepID=UPI0011A125C1|nr:MULTISPECIES: GDSL-type esterase/lipase family protein [Bacillaceae]MCM3124769.1 GDSL-type esterase/lipase family protein [Mesobacillus sp. MER 33]MCM3232922.1 GDSL-type esterase/lipase family protein [Mesobacillus sp. MER 48]WHX42006.1 GDSL-type esterase/lipase family protein [Mesobacillus sp. AQ2]